MGVGGHDRDLPPLPGPRRQAHLLERDGQEAGGHLLARGHDRVVLTRVVERRRVLHPPDELVGLACHGGDHHGHLVAGLDLAFDMPRHVADAFHRGDGRTAELHDETGHGSGSGRQKGFARREGAYT